MIPLSAQRVALQTSIAIGAYENLRYAQALLGHPLATGDLAEVVERASEAIVRELEKQRFCATSRPRPSRGPSSNPRYIPAHVKRTVWGRDGGQCTFVAESGHRCSARTRLEYDHVDPVARGGEATVEGIRLRCRTHNLYEVECVFGSGFMSDKRAEAQARAVARRQGQARAAAAEQVQARAAAEQDDERDVVPWLRKLGFRADEARRAAARCETIPDASLEERLRLALSSMAPPHRRVEASLRTAT